MSPTTSSNTTIILVHGAWHTPWHYSSLITALAEVGYPVLCPQLPSVSASDADISRDVLIIRNEIQTVVDAGRQVALVMHSYGGVVGGESSVGFDRNIVKLVYMASFPLPLGCSLVDMLPGGGEPLPWWRSTEEGTGWIAIDEDRVFYNDVEDEELLTALKAKLGTQAKGVQLSKATWEPYRSISSAYLLCEKDQALVIQVQESMVAAAGIIEVRRIDAGHSPWLAKTAETAQAIVDAIEGKL
ncbi:alpha/beta-hydrolase [Myriangium duriaei CBS 260.36]|uniref:Alpha/beta-hydrolase n=1 Tax=Myriangium duriaei CBS 260.36 TaxID=1168546 RepID=A0A9P4MC87_9PEZI|nr:alpha/beta-hydrolase [Myriangium duriaei CBS 260.36]